MKELFTAVITFVFLSLCSFGQETIISSKVSTITINNKTFIVAEDDFNFPLPFTILYPTFDEARSFVSLVNQINLIGKFDYPENIYQILLNDVEVEFTENGLFFKVIDLSEGKNDLYIKVVPKYGKIIIVRFIIDYQKPLK